VIVIRKYISKLLRRKTGKYVIAKMETKRRRK